MIFRLSEKVNQFERQVYTVLALIGDIGGFNGAIITFPSFFMAIYSGRMFNLSLLEEFSIRRTRKSKILRQNY